MSDVFFSYSDNDIVIANTLYTGLRSAGINCWMASQCNEAGEIWAESILSAIDAAKVIVLLFSDASNRSPHVLREVSLAVSRKKEIIVCRLARTEPSDSLRYYLETVHWLAAYDVPLQETISSLTDLIRQKKKHEVKLLMETCNEIDSSNSLHNQHESIPNTIDSTGLNLLANAMSKSSIETGVRIRDNAESYERAFLNYLIQYIKGDDVLKDFYIRLIYECEIIRMVLHERKSTDLWELKDILEEMKTARSIGEVASSDAAFHRRLFAIAGEEGFYKWYQLQAKTINNFLNGFWSYIGYKTKYYDNLLTIHSNIYDAIESQDENLAIKSTLEHFSILLFQLLSVTFNKE